jgi:5-formyltetrahydrofolate cyclo-ligase
MAVAGEASPPERAVPPASSMPASEGLAAAQKEDLRARMRAIRSAIPREERERLAALIEDRLFALADLATARSVLIFYSFGSEIPTRRMIHRLAREGHRLMLPFLESGDMRAAEYRPGDPLVATSHGPKEPRGRVAVPATEVEVVVTPGLAFDRSGRRLGYGGGHFDRFLTTASRRGKTPAGRPVTIGLGFHVQLVDDVPHDPLDQPVDVVLTDRETVDRRGAG